MRNLLFATTLLLPATVFAAPSGVTLSPDHAVTTFNGKTGMMHLPKWKAPSGKIKIFDTLGKGDAYDGSSGWTISNVKSETGLQQWFAFAITPKVSASVTEIVEAIGYVAGTESVTVALLADASGTPGAVLASKTITSLETFGDCCGVAVARFGAGIPVTAGTTYWVAAILPSKKQATTWDAWNYSTVKTGSGPAAFYNSNGWNVGAETYSAFAVYGQ